MLGVIGVAGLATGPAPAERPLAFVPVPFSVQQFAEGLVWVGIANHDPAATRVFGYASVLFAFFLWPIFVPLAALLVERSCVGGRSRCRLLPRGERAVGVRWIRAFGAALVLGLTGSLLHFASDFASLWCFAAAVASGAVWLHLRERAAARSALGTLPALS